NHSIKGYMTEKIYDAIIAECLTFYWGDPNIINSFETINDCYPFVLLPMADHKESTRIINQAFQEDWWSKHLPSILNAKKQILTKMMMSHRICKVIREDIDLKTYGKD